MNIWIFNHYAVAPGESGGTRHYDLSKQLIDCGGNKVTIFASSYNHQSLNEGQQYHSGQSAIEKDYNGVRFIWINTAAYVKNGFSRMWNMLTYSYRSYAYAKKLDEKPDIIIGSLVHPLAALVGYLLARKKKCLFYFEERDLWPQTLIDLGKISAKHPAIFILSQLEKFLYKKAARIIVLFDKAVNYVQSRGIDPNKVVYLPNGVDLTRYLKSNNELPDGLNQILSELSGKFLAIYLGSHGLANNLDVVLDAAKKLGSNPLIHFLFVGDGPEKQRLIQRKVDEGISNATFFSSVRKELVPVLLKKMDVGLLPLQDSPVFKWGISPNKLFDYMASELPVILLCNLEGSPVELSGGGVVIKEQFSDNLADEVLRLSESQELTKGMGALAREYVIRHHSWGNLSNKLFAIMESDLNETKKGEK